MLGKNLTRQSDSIFKIGNRSVELLLIDLTKDRADARPWGETEGEQMSPLDDWFGWRVLHAEQLCPLEKPIHGRAVEVPCTAEAI